VSWWPRVLFPQHGDYTEQLWWNLGHHPVQMRSDGNSVSVLGAEILQGGDIKPKGYKFGLPLRFETDLCPQSHFSAYHLVPPLYSGSIPGLLPPFTMTPGHPSSLPRPQYVGPQCVSASPHTNGTPEPP
jgi:hypothetical protein